MFATIRFLGLRLVALAVLAVMLALLAVSCAPPPVVTPTSVSGAAETSTVLPAPAKTAAATVASAATPIPATATAATPAETTTGAPVDQSPLANRWEGSISIQGTSQGIVVTLSAETGALAGTVDVPAQGASGIPLHDITFDDPAVHFEMFEGQRLAVFDGQINSDGSMSGQFTQGGVEGTFQLKPAQAAAAGPLPYQEEEVTFKNGAVTLGGTLTLPEGKGPFPAVVLISGSGQQNRDEEISLVPGYRPFRVIADHLTRNGVAVLRYDDRGVGQSTGDPATATTADFADDAEAAWTYLAGRPEIDPEEIGLLGHSEGGIVAPMVAARNPDVAFVVGMAPVAVTGSDLLLKQVERVVAASGASEEAVAKAVEQQTTMADLVIKQDWTGLETFMQEIANEQVQAMSQEQRDALGDLEQVIKQRIAVQVNAMKSPWYQYFLTHDAGQDWAKVTVPVLALFGGKDVQVDVDQNKPALEAALKEAGNEDVTVQVFPDANHLFLHAETGGLNEYAGLSTEFVPGFLDTITNWLAAHSLPRQRARRSIQERVQSCETWDLQQTILRYKKDGPAYMQTVTGRLL